MKGLASQGIAKLPEHGNVGRVPHHAISSTVQDATVQFIKTYSNIHGLPQPAALRARPGQAPTYLPASHKKGEMHQKCNKCLAELEPPAEISYRTFRRIWKVHLPQVRVMKRRSDVCALCDSLRQKVSLARTEEETKKAMENLTSHMDTANTEREYYKTAIANSAADDATFSHHTFDFAQQLELPTHTREVGPLYFKVKYRVQLHGIVEESQHQQWNFLYGEHQTIGLDGKKAHGPNSVLSMLHYYLAKNTSVKCRLHLHADNCVGQNKNKTVLAYLAWRCAVGLSDEVTLSFMRVGHTRCAVDGYFGLIKQKWRNSENNTMEDVEKAVVSSCTPNKACMFSWVWYDWDAFLSQYFMPVKSITKYQHFHVSAKDPGHIFCREKPDGDATKTAVLRVGVSLPSSSETLPTSIAPAGLSEARCSYLDKQVACYFSEASIDSLPWK